jgi:two-component system, OmpR family, phosphate regulon response regulator PhoB
LNPDAVTEQLAAGDLVLDRRSKRVRRSNRDVNLSPTEFRLLEQLMRNPGRVYSRSQLLDTVWGRDAFVDERTVDVHVGRLRKALRRGKEPDPIRTVRATGYAFDERFGSPQSSNA